MDDYGENGRVSLDDYLTVTEAARILKVTSDAIYIAIKKEQLKARRRGGVYFIHKDEMERYRREKRRPGRPREKRKYQRRSE